MPPRFDPMYGCAVVVFVGVVILLFAVAFVYPRMIH